MRRSCLTLMVLMVLASSARADGGFRKRIIDPQVRAEAVAAADVNRDGRLDLVAGEYWYEAPGFQPHRFRTVEMKDDYADVRFDVPEDINGDGWVDLATCHRGPVMAWLENPQGPGRPWPAHRVGESASSEPVVFADLDGDGRGEFIGPANPCGPRGCAVAVWKRGPDPAPPWTMTRIGPAGGADHGIGLGDLNRDGRLDVLAPRGWYEAPARPADSFWKYRSLEKSNTHPCVVYDFDGDGDQDVAAASPHDYGLFWYEQTGREADRYTWWRHTIDDSISQMHALAAADLDGDGDLDLVTGKRFKAHARGDPGTDDAALLVWYELVRDGQHARFERHVIDDDSGAGYVVAPVDLDGDGDIDVLSANKKGVFLFEHEGAPELLPLFDGKTLDNWVGDKTIWRVEGGAIVGHTETGLKRNNFLVSRDRYDDFVLTLDVKLVPDGANSGIQFRSVARPDGECEGYQADIGQEYWGSIYEEQGRGMLQSGFAGRADRARIREGWNHYVVYAVDGLLRVEINGTLCSAIRDDRRKTGVIALQVHSGGPTDVRFRNIVLRRVRR